MYNTVIFDVDGTLIDTEKAIMKALQKMLVTDYGREMTRDELIFVFGIPGSVSLPMLGIEDPQRAQISWNKWIQKYWDLAKIYDGIVPLLEGIKGKGAKAGVVTSKNAQELKDDFIPFGLAGYMDCLICASDTEKHKPNPEPLLKFIERTGADPQKSIYIGDTIYDYRCARDAGIDFGLAVWGCTNKEGIEATYEFNRPEDILELVSAGGA
ncbi:Phosphoglycolate phosphatase [compost metagenome]